MIQPLCGCLRGSLPRPPNVRRSLSLAQLRRLPVRVALFAWTALSQRGEFVYAAIVTVFPRETGLRIRPPAPLPRSRRLGGGVAVSDNSSCVLSGQPALFTARGARAVATQPSERVDAHMPVGPRESRQSPPACRRVMSRRIDGLAARHAHGIPPIPYSRSPTLGLSVRRSRNGTPIMPRKSSMGRGKTMVVLCSAPISRSVCK